MKVLAIYLIASICEIAGCYSLWEVLRLRAAPLWLLPGLLALMAFAFLLSLLGTPSAGRAYAAYGAIYIAASIGWMWLFERHHPDIWDLMGLAICLVGSAVIIFAPRA